MSKLLYGFDPHQPNLHDDGLHKGTTEEAAWAMLEDVQTYLKDGKPLPPELATWLGLAIEFSKPDRQLKREGNSAELLQRLGLNKRRGERSPYNRHFKAYWQGRLWHLGIYNEAGLKSEQIVKAVKDEMTVEGIEEELQPNRETLQDWLSEAISGRARGR
ncbi:hypothetical protein DJFAAGMI_04519 [Comamonas sp. PE63]|uniref:Uncharacterized protein n=1 Tax=Comamonas brasiliensis TaxID=1812482 RepID=A0ABS5LZ10_9BURK|nr:hypothetical protein [Comamonas sp. PE63]MBS3021743.1 hypothetical protein [Comamonas sp. PE63]